MRHESSLEDNKSVIDNRVGWRVNFKRVCTRMEQHFSSDWHERRGQQK